jgi:DNA-binding NarL/FixJ family response regulator
MLLAVDSDVIRRVLSDFLRDEPLIEIVGEAKDFTELLGKVLALKPRIVLMGLHMRDEYKFKPEFVRSELQASAGHVLAMSHCYDDEAVGLSNSYGASLLLDKSKLITELLRTVEKLCA